jgi:hypothetical protein
MTGTHPSLTEVLVKAAEFQRLVPGAVLVGGSAAALHAGHRQSFDHDHVLGDLAERFDAILEHLDAVGDWSLARATPGKIILGSLGGIETGLRQLIRQRPLETEQANIGGSPVIVPTVEETLRVKAWLAVTRNQTRDYLDIAALADRLQTENAAAVLVAIDEYYHDLNKRPEAVASQLIRQLGDPRPRDERTTRELAAYKGLQLKWQSWDEVRRALRTLATEMLS